MGIDFWSSPKKLYQFFRAIHFKSFKVLKELPLDP
ncbi:MAG: hypothetical protein ACI84C_001161 [Flavobacteriales bacterium]|jgi:hypothetical protein